MQQLTIGNYQFAITDKSQIRDRKPKIIMWSLLSGDFDTNISGEKCWQNIYKNAKDGDIIVFHDSEKAAERLHIALPNTLEYFSAKGFTFSGLPL